MQVLRAFSCFGVPRGGRCPPRTVFLRQATRLAAQSANVTGSHVLASLAVPHRALPLMLGRHLVRASGAHEHVSTPRLLTPSAPPLPASTAQQQVHPRSQVSRPSVVGWSRSQKKARKQRKVSRMDNRSKVHSPCPARVQGPIGSFSPLGPPVRTWLALAFQALAAALNNVS